MRVKTRVKPLTFTEDDSSLTVCYSNRGEPFRDGVELSFQDDRAWVSVLLDVQDVKAMRDKMDEFLSVAQQPLTDEQLQDLLGFGNPTEQEIYLIRLGWNAAHKIGGKK